MSNITDITVKGFEPIKAKVLNTYKAKGMKASGNFERELEIVPLPNGAVLMGADYTEQLEGGRKPTSSGASASTPTLKEKILDWIRDKGIIADGITDDSLAFLITRKIHREGWNRSKHGGVGLISDAIKEDDFKAIIDEVMKTQIDGFITNMKKIFKV
jgi:hypothetical protein